MFWLKALITVAVFYIIYLNVDVGAVWLTLVTADIGWLLVALILQLMAILLASFRWAWLMQPLSFKFDYLFYVKHYFIGMLFSQAMPSSIGGDAYRVVTLARNGYSKRLSFYAVLIDRVVGLFGLLILVLLGFILIDIDLPTSFTNLLQLLLLLGFVGIMVLFTLHKFARIRMRLFNWLLELSEQFYQALSGFWQILRQVAVSVLIHIFAVTSVFCIAKALGLTQPYWVFLLFVPISLLITMIPISFAGWGLREGAMVLLFSLVGSAKEVVLSVSLIYGVTVIIATLPAGYFFLKKDKDSK